MTCSRAFERTTSSGASTARPSFGTSFLLCRGTNLWIHDGELTKHGHKDRLKNTVRGVAEGVWGNRAQKAVHFRNSP
jgi:hypothetical protein